MKRNFVVITYCDINCRYRGAKRRDPGAAYYLSSSIRRSLTKEEFEGMGDKVIETQICM